MTSSSCFSLTPAPEFRQTSPHPMLADQLPALPANTRGVSAAVLMKTEFSFPVCSNKTFRIALDSACSHVYPRANH